MWVAIAIVWIILSILAGVGAHNKGRSFAGFFFLSLLLSPLIGLIAMAVVKKYETEAGAAASSSSTTAEPAAPASSNEIACPACGKPKISRAMCPHCGSWQG